MVEPLRKIVESPMERPDSVWSNGIHSWALLRYAEMKPEAAQPIILDQIRKLQPMYSLAPLCDIPEGLSAVDLDLLVQNLMAKGNDIERIAGLIAHYGNADIYETVKKFYLAKEGRWACASQKYFLNFFIKINREEGLNMTFHALTLREKTGCYRSSVLDVIKENYDKNLEPRFIESFLAEREADVIVNFVRIL